MSVYNVKKETLKDFLLRTKLDMIKPDGSKHSVATFTSDMKWTRSDGLPGQWSIVNGKVKLVFSSGQFKLIVFNDERTSGAY